MGNSDMPLKKEQLFAFLCNISEQYHIGIAIVDINEPNNPFVFLNDAFLHLTGYEKDELIGRNITILEGLRTNKETQEEFEYHLIHKTPFRLNLLHYRKDQVAFWNHISCEPIKDDNGQIQYAMLHCSDITELMLGKMLSKLEHEVYSELEKGVELVDICNLITKQVERYYIRDIYCSIHFVKSISEIVPIASGSLSLESIKAIHKMDINSTKGCNERAIYIEQLSHESCQKINATIKSCWTKPIFNNDQQLIGYVSIYLKNNAEPRQPDIHFLNKLSPIIGLSIKYAEQKQQLQRLAYFDLSSGIPNYNYFYTNLKQWAEQDIKGYILLTQPSEYASIVDLFGRKIGDKLIGQLIERLESIYDLNTDIIYGRFSNSTFILATKLPSLEIDNLIKKLFEITNTPFSIAEREIFISLKIGIANFDETISIDESIRRSDIALTKSSNQKGAVVSYFEAETDEKIQRELEIVNQLTHGLQNDEFTIHLQPKVNLLTAAIEGFEALARWYSPVLGPISPAEFIPIAEQTGKISQVDNVVLQKVLKFQNERKSKGLKLVPISVNISPVHFYRESFVDDFISLVNKYEISPEFIKIEVTESVELFDHRKAKEILIELKKYGYESSIDDFGVGFSSLSYLQQLPFSEIKIDRSFINGIEDNGMHAVVQTIVQLASNLKMHAVAEGIETAEQYKLLQKMGCRTGQGYYFHKPMPIEEAEKLLDA
ncbi:PAS domain S-box-containing protein [Ureibacillus xyleni]|uniref:PAS domain S-box-containing protein n=1 Tax=Ureibacillus xyleni TaxID=614648 RepID=A0A285TGW7_9BACL|nr:GGDEF domain-containing phosphodiesterase [Ureibacillus xyleni]SOC20998.1 PAS domain S-box-containing protein [Ureibacillus xyleni]